MNMSNVMNTMPKAVNIKNTAGGSRVAGGENSSGRGDDFGRMLHKAGAGATETDVPADVATSPTAEVSDGTVASTGADVPTATESKAELPQDPLATVMAATQQGSWQGVLLPSHNADGVASNEAYTPNLPQGEPVDLLTQPKLSADAALQSVMPQSPELNEQSQRLLDMLSGTAFPVEEQASMPNTGGNLSPLTTPGNDATDVLLPKLVRNDVSPAENLFTPASAPKQQATLAFDGRQQELPPLMQDVLPAASEKDLGQPSAFPQFAPKDAAQMASSLSAEFAPLAADNTGGNERTRDLAARLWGNAPITETTEPEFLPDALRQTAAEQQFDGRGAADGRQMFGGQSFGGHGTPMQLPEEAVGDAAPVNTPLTTNNEQSAQPAGFAPTAANATANEQPAAAQNNQPPVQVRDDYNVQRQIVEQARLLRRGADTEMVIRLKPEHLGDLTLRVSVTPGGSVNASFHSDNAQVRMIIENSLVQLKQELADQGIKVDKVEVYTGLADGQMPQGQGRQAWQQGNGGEGVRNLEADMAAFEDTAESLANGGENNPPAEGVDYRV